jgi:hypothetical protein
MSDGVSIDAGSSMSQAVHCRRQFDVAGSSMSQLVLSLEQDSMMEETA